VIHRPPLALPEAPLQILRHRENVADPALDWLQRIIRSHISA
jgi:hypothetical protein